MATFSAAFADLLERQEKTIYFRRMTEVVRRRSQLFDIVSSDKAYEDRQRVAGLGRMALKPEGTPVAFDDPVIGSRIRTVHDTFALGWRCTMEMRQDDLFNVMDRMTEELADSTVDKQERNAWALIDGAYGTGFTGLDGLALFSTAHTNLKLGPNQSNMLSPAVALGTTGIEAMMTLANTTTNEEGRFIELPYSTLVIHPNLEWQAKVLLDTEYEVDSANNNINTVNRARTGLKILTVPYLTSETNWSIHAAPGKNSLTINNRMSPEFDQAGDPDTKDLKHYACFRESAMFSEWRGNWGSQA
jgi:hypothetical protein